ncbi:MAG TPA: Sec-independent protein translocase protein TatB [Rhizomicrobium sp.]|nr:Sec-independent protein translocase protein TatB [Rhizomicrobium sp.]
MIDLSWSHILIVLVVALVVVGPKDLPRLMRMMGRWLAKARAMADQFRRSFDEMARQAELDELRAEIQALRNERPFGSIEQTLREPVMRSTAAADPAPHDAAPPAEADAEPLPVSHEPETHDAIPPEPIAPGAEPPPP